MKIQENILLAPYTTFKIGGIARFFCVVANEDELVEAVNFAKEKGVKIIVLGGGSNVLISDSGFSGLVIHMAIKGISIPDSGSGLISVGAGEILDEFIEKMVAMNLYGLENLSSIPGTVGATPIQNISAYGQEIGNVIHSVRVLDIRTMKFIEIKKDECKFSYRDSMFKSEKGKYIISAVIFHLSNSGKVDIGYKDLSDYFVLKGIANPTLTEVRNAVIEIRAKKLPDWKQMGTAGSFFKNPIISMSEWKELEKRYPKMAHFMEPDGRVKIALGWILDNLCNAKGLTMGNVGTYEKQALVVIAKKGATANEVLNLTNELMNRVKEKTGIEIEAEVEWVF